jgi:hypothetical protein
MRLTRAFIVLGTIAVPLLSASSLSCSRSSQGSDWKLEMSSSAASTNDGQAFKIEMQAGETTIVELLVVGSAPGSVEFAASGLPAFGTLQGPLLKFVPGRQDAGHYDATVTATSGGDSQTVALRLVVQRPNTAPTYNMIFFYDNHGLRSNLFCPGTACTIDGTGTIEIEACDAEGDAMTIELEVVRADEPFTNVPTHSASILRGDPNGSCGSGSAVLAGLALEQSYKFEMRITDEWGAVARWSDADGWLRAGYWVFDQGPCTTRQCACAPTGSPQCGWGGYVCCSGVCGPGYQCQ